MPEHTPAPTPSRAVYGFSMFLCLKFLFAVYLVWALVPEEYFEKIGITYMPKRYWAVAIPILLLTFLAIFAFIIYPSLGLIMTPDIDDIRTIRDDVLGRKRLVESPTESSVNNIGLCCNDATNCKKRTFEDKINQDFYNNRIAPLYDVEISYVSKKLYL